MPQQELNLLQLSSAVMTQLQTGPPQVVGCYALQARSPTTRPDHVPHDILRDSNAPYFSRLCHAPDDPSLCDPGRSYPLIERGLDPRRNGHSADVAALADQVYYRPVSLAHLDFTHLQAHQLRSAKAATKQHGQHRVVALGAHRAPTGMFEHFGTLRCAQPVAGAKSELLDSFHPADPAASSGLSNPASAASCASLRTAASCWLMVLAARPRDSKCMR